MITSPSGKKYIGQTIQPFEKRWKQHIDSAQRKYKDNCRILNKTIRKYGKEQLKIEVLEVCQDRELDAKEQEYIQKYNTIVPYGMNIKAGGKSGKHNEETKLMISQSLKGRVVSRETREKLSSTTNPDLPMYMLKIKNGYRISNHPMGPEKRFISKTKPIKYNYERALEYLKKLDGLKQPLEIQRKIQDTYIQKYKHGFCVKYPGAKPKYFVSKNVQVEELYKSALNFLNEIKLKSAVQRLNGSGGIKNSLKI
jgi:group I intron endonuclease